MIADNRDLDISLGAKLCIFSMAAYTLPEGFTDFDMFTFGTALLVGGKWAPEEIFVQRLKQLATLEVFGLGQKRIKAETVHKMH